MRPKVVLACLVTLSAILGAVFVLVDSSKTAPVHISGSWNDYRSADDLVRDSDVIFVGEFISQESRTVEVYNPGAGATGHHLEQILRTFSVKEVLKGSVAGAQVKVGYTTRFLHGTKAELSESYEITSVSKGVTYVLFVRAIPDEPGILGFFAEPGQAKLENEQLTFQVTKRYEKDLRDFQEASRLQGLPVQATGAVPFSLDLPTLRALVRNPGTRPPVPVQQETSPGKTPPTPAQQGPTPATPPAR